jgi:pyruvate/2-oxoglutarate/acetoin dehydrogenase E1 component
MAELTLVEAVNDAFHVELERDPDVMVMGEDVGRAGGVFRATAGLRERFGPDRCVDTPLAEAGILGSAVGLCMAGWRPVCEMQYDAFSYPCLDQLITHVGRYRWRTGGAMAFPLVVRMPYGGGVRAPELHDDSPEAYYVHTPGVKVAIPSTRPPSAIPIRSSCWSRSSTTGRCAARCRKASTSFRSAPRGRCVRATT